MASRRRARGRVRAVGRGGEAVVETEHGIVLAAGALPDELVELVGVEKRGRVLRGKVSRVLKESSGRVNPPCPIADRCGGCPLMIADPALQRRIKEGFLLEACSDMPGAEKVSVQWIAAPQDLGYRRRARLVWNEATFGYRRGRSKRIVDVPRCMVLTEPLQRGWTAIRAQLGGALSANGEMLLTASGDQVAVELRTRHPQPPRAFEACSRLAQTDVVASVSLRTGDDEVPAVWGHVESVIPAYDGTTLKAPAGSFCQANDAINRLLVDYVTELARPTGMRVLELHCGVGNFTVSLAKTAATLVAVESDPAACKACRANVARRGLEARVVRGDANHPPEGRYDVVVLDPPRQGAKELFEDGRALERAARVVYVSCDSATLGRDLRLARNRGFRLDAIMAFDMFPQTAHLETLVRLVR